MLTGLITIIVSTVYYAVLNANLYTDRARMPNGEVSVRQQSPIDRLYAADLSALLYLQLIFAAVSVITGILTLFGVRTRVVRTVRQISTIASTVMFVVILIITGSTHPNYA